MIVLRGRNVHSALRNGLKYLRKHGIKEDSRNGPVLRAPEPVTTVYERPTERVLLWPLRDANPFFHFYESLWMLAGRNDVAPLTKYVKGMVNFSDNGRMFNAAYGWRWRQCKHGDQLTKIIENLLINPNCRRQVLQIWKAGSDLVDQHIKSDIACNLSVTFQKNGDVLDMTVFCRSNDMVWGAYGANAVHFSMLHEFIARMTKMPVGIYRQVSVNFHAYIKTAGKIMDAVNEMDANPYSEALLHRGGKFKSSPLADVSTDASAWLEDCERFVTDDGTAGEPSIYADSFWQDVAWPIVKAHDTYKGLAGYAKATPMQRTDAAIERLDTCRQEDWRIACQQWLVRRAVNRVVGNEGE